MDTVKRCLSRAIAIFMVVVLFIGIAPAECFADVDFSRVTLGLKTLAADGTQDGMPSSAVAPEGYTAKSANTNKIKKARAAEVKEGEAAADVLLIQDNLPWDSYANEDVLNELNINYKMITTAELSTENLWDYKMIVIANDQTFSTYENFKTFKSNIDLFANLGGVVIFGACDSGWADGEINFDLPGGLKKEIYYDWNNYIEDNEHPIVTGILTDGTALKDEDLDSNYCSHGNFIESTLPKDTEVILRSSYNNCPTLIEYPYGSGRIIASTLTWEHNYTHTETFAPIAMDDLFAYGYSLCNEGITGNKMQIGVDSNSFVHSNGSFFGDKEKHQYQIDDDLFNRLTSYYDEDLLKWETLPNVRQLIQKQRVSDWGGSCYGISTSMALAFVGEIDLTNFDKTATNYFTAKAPATNPRFRSLINYYQLSQYLPAIDKKSVDVYAKDAAEYQNGIKTIVKMALQSEKSGYPFIFTFGYKYYTDTLLGIKLWESAGHAIVCVGCEKKDDSYRLQFVDPNEYDNPDNIGNYIYANVPADFSSLKFETMYNTETMAKYNHKEWNITRVGYDTLTLFKSIDIDGADNKTIGLAAPKKAKADFEVYSEDEEYDVILFNSETAFSLKTDDGKTLKFDGAEITGDLDIKSVDYYERGDSVDYQLAVDPHETYVIDQEREDIDITIYNADEDFYAFVGNGSEKIAFTMDEGVSATGEEMDCSVFCGIKEDNVDMIEVTNDKTDNFAVKQDAEALVVEGDNVKDVVFTGFFENDITEIDTVKTETEDAIVVNKDDIHIHDYKISRVEPTCSTKGEVTYTCECGHTYKESLEALPHTYNEWKVTKEATCAAEGSKQRVCALCKAVDAQPIAKKAHTPGEWIVTKDANVNEAGSKHTECSVCKAVIETATIAQLKCAKPKLKTIANTADGVKITWGKVSGADSYVVYRKTGSKGKYAKLTTTKKTGYTDKKAKSGKKYYYIVKAVNEAGSSSASKSLSKYYLADPVLKTPKSTKKGVTLQWNKITGADGYMVYRKTGSGSYKKIATVKGVKKVKYTDKSAKKGKTYTYKIKAYKSKTYSAYSNAKKIKDKY